MSKEIKIGPIPDGTKGMPASQPPKPNTGSPSSTPPKQPTTPPPKK